MCNLYERIEMFCEKQNIRFAELSRETGLSQTVFSELKHGKTKSLSLEKVMKIADYFDISLDELIGRKKEAPSPERDEAVGKVTDLFNQMTEEQKDFFLRLLEQTVQQAPKR